MYVSQSHEHWFTIGKVIAIMQRMTFLLYRFVLACLLNLLSPTLQPLQKKPFQLVKTAENTRFQVYMK